MADTVPTIRSFKDAPVIETVLSIQFKPIPGFTIPHFGLYWKEIREEFKHCEIKNPIVHMMEDFQQGPAQRSSVIDLELSPERAIRYWFMDHTRNTFIQVQQDRFIFNWQRIEKEDVYPRYKTTREKFLNEWKRFCDFLTSENLPTPEVDQCEVTYVNHLEYTAGWDSYGELNKIVSYWSGKASGDFLPPPEKVNINIRYAIPNNQGRLYVSLQPVIRTRDAIEVLQLNLTVRGAPVSSKTEDVFNWLDLGRKWIVQGFTDFTTNEMHQEWGLER